MVIGFDGSRAFIGEKTGTENYSFQLLKALLKIDRKNKYILYTRLSSNNIVPLLNCSIVTISLPYVWTQIGLSSRTFIDPLDVLFVPAHTLPVIRKPGLKTVVTVHDLGSEYLPKMHQVKQRLYLAFMQRYQLATATKIIAVSKTTKKDLVKRLGIDPDRIAVVYEGYDKKLFRPVKDDILVNSLKQYKLEPGKYFLFVGTVQPRKNLERVIVAFSRQLSAIRQKNKKLVIAGSKGWLSDEIYKLPKKLGIEDRVKFLGYVPDKNMPALYNGAIALVLPSLFEGFGLPILEAQACSCPVITSNISSMPEVSGKGAILVDPYSVDDIVRGMREIKGIREKLIKAGFKNIKRFSWEKCARETLKVLENI